MMLPNFNKHTRVEKGNVRSLVTSFLGLADEGIYSYLHIKRQNAFHKALRNGKICRFG